MAPFSRTSCAPSTCGTTSPWKASERRDLGCKVGVKASARPAARLIADEIAAVPDVRESLTARDRDGGDWGYPGRSAWARTKVESLRGAPSGNGTVPLASVVRRRGHSACGVARRVRLPLAELASPQLRQPETRMFLTDPPIRSAPARDTPKLHQKPKLTRT